MPREEFSQVAVFVRGYIDSVGQLEILLLLHETPGDSRTARQINATLRSSLSSVESRLAGLQSRGLVASSQESGERQYRYAPKSPELGQKVDLLATVYQEYRGRIIDLIFSPKDRLREFSDAFRLKDDEEDDNA